MKDLLAPFRIPRLPGPVIGLLAVLGLFVWILAAKGELGNFLSLSNVQLMLHANVIMAVIALGMLLVILSGGIDLSVGSVVALVTVVTMQVYRALEARPEWSDLASVAAVLAGLTVAVLAGLINGLVITRLKVAPFVATLGMMSMSRGLAYWLSDRTLIAFPGARPGWVDVLRRSRSEQFLFDPGVWSLLPLALGMAFLLHATVFGRYCYAIGSNEATARLCGVRVERCKLGVYALAGFLTGWAGVLTFAQTGSGDPNAAMGLELIVIASVVIGGASLSGGQGTVTGTLLGALIWAVLDNGVGYAKVPVEVKFILIGAIVVVNTALSGWQRRRSE
jgi:ribose transport system permease protein